MPTNDPGSALASPAVAGARGGRRFHLLRVLGEGSFGAVHLADMEGAGGFRRRVALKMLNASWDPESDAGRRLRDEARMLGLLQHRNIVRVDDLVDLGGRWGLVMEYVGGADLEVVLNHAIATGRTVPARAVAQVLADVANALDAAAGAPDANGRPLRVVHRDIKPSNIRVTEEGQVKVLDFGVARADMENREARTERVRYGSVGYMAPERLLGDPEDAPSDVYAVGVVLYEMLTLQTFGRCELAEDRHAARVGAAVAEATATSGSAALGAMLERCLAYEPGSRPTAADVRSGLLALAPELPGDDAERFFRTFLADIPSPSTAPSRVEVLEEGGTTETRASSPTVAVSGTLEPASAQGVPRGTLMLATAGAFAAVLAAAFGALSLRGPAVDGPRTGDAPPPPVVVPSTIDAPAPPTADATPAPSTSATPETAASPAAATAPALAAPSTTVEAPVTGTAAARPPTARAPEAPSETATASARVAGSSVTEPTQPDAPRIRNVKFALSGGTSIRARCGDVSGSGASSVLLKDVPVGTCTVTADTAPAVTVEVSEPRGFNCLLDGGRLSCS